MSPTKKKVIHEKDATEVAELFFDYGPDGKAKNSKKEIGNKLKMHPKTVTALLRYAIKNRIVEVKFNKQSGAFCDDELRPQIENKYSNLHHAIVVRLPMTISEELDTSIKSDRTHEELARQMAFHLLHVIRDGDTIGVGSGRGAVGTCNQLRDLVAKKGFPLFTEVRLVALTGTINATHWTDSLGTLDADDAIIALSSICSVEPENKHILGEIIRKRGEEGPVVIPPDFTPDWCVIGVGHLVGNHRFVKDPGDALKTLEYQFNKLNELISERAYDIHTNPIGDICNHLFVCSSAHPLDQIDTLINEINESLVCATPSDLSCVKHVYIVAGEADKANVIHEVLTSKLNNNRITICTDADCAERMLTLS